MSLYVRFEIGAEADSFGLEAISPNVRVSRRGLEIYSAETADLDYVFRVLSESGLSVPDLGSLTFVDQSAVDWACSREDIVAGVVVPDHVQRAGNPSADYSPELSAPACGMLNPDKPVWIEDMPHGHLASAGNELIVSEQLGRYFTDLSGQVHLGDVVRRQRTVPGWRRLFVTQTCSVLDSTSFLPVRACALSGETIRPRVGVWIARSNPDLPAAIGSDALGYRYHDLLHPVVITPAVAEEVSRLFRDGLGLEPVYSHDSPVVRLVRKVRGEVARLLTS